LSRAFYIVIFFYSVCFISSARAEVDWASVIWHNDIFANRDGGGYTNGLYISWYDLSNEGDEKLKPPLLTLPLVWMQDDKAPLAYSAHTLGQAMITPRDISKEIPDPNDAPYAGLLFFRSSYIVVDDNFADAVSLLVGVLGPASGAEKTQRFIHKITDSTEPQGWDSQLGNEPIGQISRTGVWRFATSETSPVDGILLANIGLGNLESSAGGGIILRAGTGLAKSFSTAALLTGRISNPMAVDGGWYIYAGATVDYVHNQIFVNGNTFRDSPSANLRHEQHAVLGGISYSLDNLSISISYQDGSALDTNSTSRQQFGALTLAWRL
jgi:lipid A 3-O-deacylase